MAAAVQAQQPPPQPHSPPQERSQREARQAQRRNGGPNNANHRLTRSPTNDDPELRSPTSDSALEDAMIAQAQHQRAIAINQQQQQQQQRNAGQRRSYGQQAPPPAFFGPPTQGEPDMEAMNIKRAQQGNRQAQNLPPQSRHSRHSSDAAPLQQQQGAPRPRNSLSAAEDPSLSGASINRLQSPSIMKSVLQPLELKMNEYEALMSDAQNQMTSLDAEIAALQDRRRQAEERFVEAKVKHDDYERQHDDVSRALRGELPRTAPQMMQQQQPQSPHHHQQMSQPGFDRMDSYDSRAMSEHSYRKPKKGGFRMSLFR